MEDHNPVEQVIRLSAQIERVRAMERKLVAQLKRLMATATADDDVEALLADCNRTLTESIPTSAAPAPTVARKRGRPRRSKYPEGPPLNHKVLEFLKKAGRPCGYEDVLTEVTAHHQSIQNTLRDLENRGLVERQAPNEWVVTDKAMKLGGKLSVVE